MKLLKSHTFSLFIWLAFFQGTFPFLAYAKPIKLTFNSWWPPNSVEAKTIQYFCDEAYKRSNGQVKITHFAGATLTSPSKVYQAVILGISDIGYTAVPYNPGRFPASDVMELPTDAATGWVASRVAGDFFDHFQPKEFSQVKILSFHAVPPYVLGTSEKPINHLDDLKGLKLRAGGRQSSTFISALGATPNSMPMRESYEAVSKNVIDGILTTWSTFKNQRHAEVLHYSTVPAYSISSADIVFMNKKRWNMLPEDIKQMFIELNNEMREIYAKVSWWADIEGYEYFLASGGKVNQLPESDFSIWKKRLAPLADDYIRSRSDMGLPATKYVEYIAERTKYWNNQQPTIKSVKEWVEGNILNK